MNFKDTWETDENGNQFIFTVEMKRELSEAGLPVEVSALSQLEGYHEAAPSGRSERDDSGNGRSQSSQNDIEEPFTIQIDPQTGKYIGRMKWYNAKKGYGFLMRGGGEEIFFHKTGTVGEASEFQEGQWVLYDMEETRKGPEATEIEPYEKE